MASNKVSIALVAKQAGVSSATVSRVLNHPELVNEETVRTVSSIMESLGYKPQPSRAKNTSDRKLILIHVPETSNPFYDEVITGVTSANENHAYRTLISQGDLNHRGAMDNFVQLLEDTRAGGVILCSNLKKEYCDRISAAVPLVQCCEYSNEDYSYVSIDDFRAAYTAMEHIYSTGHRKIAFVNGPSNFKYATERFHGYEAFLEYAGLPFQSSWCINIPEINYEIAFAATSQMLNSSEPPDAVLASSDVIAAAVIKAAKLHQLNVPEDLIVVGFDNVFISTISDPPITTISQPRFQIGYTAGEILHQHIVSKQAQPQHIILNTELIIRASSSHIKRMTIPQEASRSEPILIQE